MSKNNLKNYVLQILQVSLVSWSRIECLKMCRNSYKLDKIIYLMMMLGRQGMTELITSWVDPR